VSTNPHPDVAFDVAHVAHTELLSTDPEGTRRFFCDFLGMIESGRADGSIYLRAYEEYYHHSLKITPAGHAGFGHVALRARSAEALARRVSSLEQSGLGIGWIDGDLGHGPAYRFELPSGQLFEIFYEVDYYDVPPQDRSPLLNRPQRRPPVGIPVRRIDHVTFTAPDVAATREFMERHLGFRLREALVSEDGLRELGAWMSVGPLVHDVAVTVDPVGAAGRSHHVCYWYGIPQHVADAAEVLREHGYEIESGPGKHGLAQGIFLYVWEPGGNRVELYGDAGYLIFDPDWKPIVWRESQFDWAVAVYGVVPETFFTVATPPVAETLSGVLEADRAR
jgi:catechol 2,3-dioxygenase